MINELRESIVRCPYCGEMIDVMIDCSVPNQNYIEDCSVCCRPINFDVTVTLDDELRIIVSDDNE